MTVYPLFCVGTYEDAFELVGVFSTPDKRAEFVRRYPRVRFTVKSQRTAGEEYSYEVDLDYGGADADPIEVDGATARDIPQRGEVIDAACDCIASGNANKPKQHGADPHAKNCAIYTRQR